MNFLSLFGPNGSSRNHRVIGCFTRATKVGPGARSAMAAQSDVLSEIAHSWARSFPLQSRPLELCNLYPRVANRIAECWEDFALTEAVLDDLLVDHRGGRKGFPAQIAIELLRLQALHEGRPNRTRASQIGSISLA